MNENVQFKSTHNLGFEVAESPYSKLLNDYHMMFRIGTCEGQWGCISDSYYILSVVNKVPGNGHLTDVLEWFEQSCRRDKKNLMVLECSNKGFYNHLIQKRGFISLDKEGDNCIKVFNQILYKRMLKKGNEILIKGSLKCV